jgi:hypothetical protein
MPYYEGEKGFNLEIKIRENDETPSVLTGLEIKLYMWEPEKNDNQINGGTCTITNPPGTDGRCYYPVIEGDFVEGNYEWEVILTKTGVLRRARGTNLISIKKGHPGG